MPHINSRSVPLPSLRSGFNLLHYRKLQATCFPLDFHNQEDFHNIVQYHAFQSQVEWTAVGSVGDYLCGHEYRGVRGSAQEKKAREGGHVSDGGCLLE